MYLCVPSLILFLLSIVLSLSALISLTAEFSVFKNFNCMPAHPVCWQDHNKKSTLEVLFSMIKFHYKKSSVLPQKTSVKSVDRSSDSILILLGCLPGITPVACVQIVIDLTLIRS